MRSLRYLCALALLLPCACKDEPEPMASGSESDSGSTDTPGDGDPTGDGDPVCEIATEGCPCTQGGSCNPGLICDGGICTGCEIATEGCPCTDGGSCNPGLLCDGGVCLPASGDGDGDPGDGDPGDGAPGDGDPGDGDPGDGDPGDGDPGDGDPGDGDPGDGDPGDGDGDPGDGDPGDGDGDGDVPPEVVSTTPADQDEGVDKDTTIEITFSEAMDPTSLTANIMNTNCTGSLQVSSDGFMTCVRMVQAPSTGDNLTFSVTPDNPLLSATEYQIRVLASVTDAGGTNMLADFTTGQGFIVRYFHTIVMDGINDFDPDETFASSTQGHTGYVAWDEGYLYLGFDSPDLASADPMTWFVAYLGGSPGSASGVLYNTQEPALAFEARWHMRWKASADFGSGLVWDDNQMSWQNAGFGPIADSDDVVASGSYVEMQIAWSDLGDPQLIGAHLQRGGLAVLTGFSFTRLPTGFLPTEDQGYLLCNVQLPDAASLVHQATTWVNENL